MVELTVSWSGVSGASEYDVFHRSTGNIDTLDDYDQLGSTDTTSYTADFGTGDHSFRVVAKTSTGVASKKSAPTTITVPEAPTGVGFSDTSVPSELTLTWSEESKFDEYTVYQAQSVDVSFSEYTHAATTSSPPATVDTLDGGEQYYFRVTGTDTSEAESVPSQYVTTQPRYETDERVSWWDTLTSGDPVPLDVVDEPGDGADVDVQDGELLVTTDGAVAVPDPDTASVVGIAGTGQKVTLSTESDTTPFSPSSTIYPNDRITLRSDGSTWYILE